MKQITVNSGQGFTLIEVIASVAIFSLIIVGVSELVSGILVNSNQQGSLLANNDSARRAAFTLMQELRNATTSATGGYALETAADQQIIFYTNTGATVDRIRYYIQTGNLYKGVVKPTGSPTVYNVNSETTTLLQQNVANAANPLFYYYDGSYNGQNNNPLVQPVNVTAARLVKINLVIYKGIRVKTTSTYTVTASGSIRNLKTNLGS